MAAILQRQSAIQILPELAPIHEVFVALIAQHGADGLAVTAGTV